ncbi:MAG: HAD-IC family P-type ATPase [Bacteroidales bacterium]|nr:HAD-IC family P-type ATPase [Bacteroidales bacterium]
MKKPNKTGLDDLAVLNSRRMFGINRMSLVTNAVKESSFFSWSLLKNVQFWVITVLIVCTALSLYLVSDEEYPVWYRTVCNLICVIAAYLISMVVFYYLRHQTKKSADNLVNIHNNQVKVVRNGVKHTVSVSDVVVNDIVMLEEGTTIPADGILLKSAGLRVDESVIGGNNDVPKRVGAGTSHDNDIYPSDWMMGGTVVFDGNGMMKVTRVGDQTEYGKVYHGSKNTIAEKIPFVILVSKVSKMVAGCILVYSALVFLYVYFFGTSWTPYRIITIPVNFIVAALPVIVPYAVSIITLVANRKMAEMGVKVKDMNTPYAMGMISTIISGRFGLITSGLMNVTNVFIGCSPDKNSWIPAPKFEDNPSELDILFYRALSLVATAGREEDSDNKTKKFLTGAAEESAIMKWMNDNNVPVAKFRENEVIIDRVLSMRDAGMCAVLVEGDGENYVYAMGMPKELFACCRYVQSVNGRHMVDEQVRELYDKAKSESPYLLSVAYARVPQSIKRLESAENLTTVKMTLLGLIYIDDRIRQGISAFSYSMENSNVKVKVITSLRKESAVHLAHKASIVNDYEANNLDGEDSVCLTSQELMERNNGRMPYEVLDKMKVISQVSLTDRFEIVRTMQQNGEIVAVTASELRVEQLQDVADVPITMRSEQSELHNGTVVSINKNHLDTLHNAIKMGRQLIRCEGRIYDLMIGLSLALVALDTAGILLSGGPIISIIQMFWIDIVCIGIATFAMLSITTEESLNSQSTHKYSKFARSTDFVKLALTIAVFDFLMVFAFWMFSAEMDITQVSDLWTKELKWGIPTNPSEQFSVYERTIIMTLLVMCTFWNVIILKVFGSTDSLLTNVNRYWKFFLMALLIPFTHFLMIHFGGDYVITKSITYMDWVYLIAITSILAIYIEIVQFIRRYRAGKEK